MKKFKGENAIEFHRRFKTDLDCKAYLADLKWANGFTCLKCKHDRATVRKGHSRCCTRCKHIESPSSGTLFHKVKFGLHKAFTIVFEMTATTKGLSAGQMGRRLGIKRQTAWLFMQKVRTGMGSSGRHPMEGPVVVDEFVIGGKETGRPGRSHDSKKKKVVCAVELTDSGKVKRMYAQRIDDFSGKSLRPIFDRHISKDAEVTTDEWKGYRPIAKDYRIRQMPSDKGRNFKRLHTVIHQVKSWVRTVYSWVHRGHTDRYLAEFCYRLNRSIHKRGIFHGLIERMVHSNPAPYKTIIVSS
jgi:transposase-like protein